MEYSETFHNVGFQYGDILLKADDTELERFGEDCFRRVLKAQMCRRDRRLSDIWDADSELIPGKYPMLLIGNSSHSNYWNSTFWKKNGAGTLSASYLFL